MTILEALQELEKIATVNGHRCYLSISDGYTFYEDGWSPRAFFIERRVYIDFRTVFGQYGADSEGTYNICSYKDTFEKALEDLKHQKKELFAGWKEHQLQTKED